MEGGYRIPFDPRPLFAKLQANQDVEAVWNKLWNDLHHQGDVGEASYAAVPHLVRIHRERGVADWNTYAIVATIELARDSARNPPIPAWLEPGYDNAIQELADLGREELPRVDDGESVRSILAILAIAKGARIYGRILADFSEEEVLELGKEVWGTEADSRFEAPCDHLSENIKLTRLLSELCTDLGFSLPLRDPARFEKLLPSGIDAFTDAIFLAEGLDPQMEKQLRRKVRERVANHFAAWPRDGAE
jgi:hypothetical protein